MTLYDWQEVPAPKEWAVLGKTSLDPDDVLFVRPTQQGMTPNQARELQEVLERKLDRQVVVIPFPAEVAITHVSKVMTLDLLSKITSLETEVKALRSEMRSATDPRLFSGR